MIHDLRNGLGILTLSLDALKKTLPDEPSRSVFAKVEKQLLNQKRLLLSLSEMVGSGPLQDGLPKTLPIRTLTTLLAELISELHTLHGFDSIELHAPASSDELGSLVHAHWDLLRQAIENAVDNAAHAKAARCRIRIENRPGSLLIQVLDDGAGIPLNQVPGVSWGFSTRGSGVGTRTIRRNLCQMSGIARWKPSAEGGTVLELELEKA